MDVVDQSDQQNSNLLEARIKDIASKPLNTANPKGVCLATDCNTVTGYDKRWCCPECRDIWQMDNEDLSPSRKIR